MDQKLLQILQTTKSLQHFNQTHAQIFAHGLQNNNYLLPKLISLSTTLNSLDNAIKIFENTHSPNTYVYSTMIESFLLSNRRKDAFNVYNILNSSLNSPNCHTITFLLKSCKSPGDVWEGKGLHTHIVKMGFGYSVFVNNTLLRFYSSCSGSVGCSRKLFDEMLERDVVSWNTMICAYMGHGEMEFAMGLFDLMPERNVVSWNSVVTGFCKAGEMRLAGLIFERMIVRNEFSWNCMISGYARVGDMVNARLVFDQMPEKTVISWTAMITGYANVRDVMSASVFFNLMPVKNVVSWNAMIAGYVHNHVFDQALNVFHQMLMSNSDGGSCRPDEATLTTALSACAHLGSLEQGKWIESYIKKYNIGLSVSLGNTLIDMFAKCGDIENAKLVFNGMRNRSIFTWTTLVSGLAFNGLCREALDLFDTLCNENDKTEPDDVIFIAVLSACTHGGLVEEGKRVFHQMMRQFGIEPRIEHYGCMVDLLSRAGKVEEALSFVMSMPMEPNAIIWATLLGSCQVYGNRELVQVVSKRILGLEPSNPAYLMLISNSNASMGRWEDVLNVRATMRNRGIEKVPGCSSIQVGNKVLEFLVKDTRHERTSEIYESLHSLNDHLKASVDN